MSYAWDSLVEQFNKHLLAGTQYYASHPAIREQEQALRIMAREPRVRRRMLAGALMDLLQNTPELQKTTRTIPPMRAGQPCYVMLLLPHPDAIPYEQYRAARMNLLRAHCQVAKLKFPMAEDILGIAMETGMRPGSEDLAYLDAREWTGRDEAEAQRVRQELLDMGILGPQRGFGALVQEYPEVL